MVWMWSNCRKEGNHSFNIFQLYSRWHDSCLDEVAQANRAAMSFESSPSRWWTPRLNDSQANRPGSLSQCQCPVAYPDTSVLFMFRVIWRPCVTCVTTTLELVEWFRKAMHSNEKVAVRSWIVCVLHFCCRNLTSSIMHLRPFNSTM